MSFELFGIDIVPKDKLYGFRLIKIVNYNGKPSSFLSAYYVGGTLFISICFVPIMIGLW